MITKNSLPEHIKYLFVTFFWWLHFESSAAMTLVIKKLKKTFRRRIIRKASNYSEIFLAVSYPFIDDDNCNATERFHEIIEDSNRPPIVIDGVTFPSLRIAAYYFDIKLSTVRRRLESGLSIEMALCITKHHKTNS